jgi:glyoxylase-like metal-dependent hydrolase (beta-lactamase superfamily II)
VQVVFAKIYNLENFPCDGSQFDVLWKDNATFNLGNISCRVMHTPGHTPACVSYLIGDAVFVGDTIFMPDFGTARCDFPGGSAHTLFLYGFFGRLSRCNRALTTFCVLDPCEIAC